MQQLNIQQIRNATPGCNNVLHFNNAGTGLMPDVVVESLIAHTRLEAAIGGYEAQDREIAKLDNYYNAAARLINCNRDEIAFADSSTRAWDMAFYSIPFKPGDIILTGMAEYESNYLAFLQIARKLGVNIEVIPNDASGQISLTELQNKISNKVKLIAITYIPTNSGLINPAAAIGAIAKQAGILYLLDACQAAGHIKLDVQQLNCDFLTFTGRKYLRGPRGTGALYVKAAICDQLEPIFIDLQAAEWTATNQFKLAPGAQRFEQWECNCSAKIALGVAMDYALSLGMDAIEQRILKLGANLRTQLSQIKNLELLDIGKNKCGIVAFNISGIDPDLVKQKLQSQNINISISTQRYTRLDMQSRNLTAVCRASVHYYNTDEEIARFCGAVDGLGV